MKGLHLTFPATSKSLQKLKLKKIILYGLNQVKQMNKMEGVTDGNVFTQPLLRSNMHSREEELQKKDSHQYLGYAVSLPWKMKFHLYFFHAHTKLSIAESQDMKIQQGLCQKFLVYQMQNLCHGLPDIEG